jgi:hypothetical protein
MTYPASQQWRVGLAEVLDVSRQGQYVVRIDWKMPRWAQSVPLVYVGDRESNSAQSDGYFSFARQRPIEQCCKETNYEEPVRVRRWPMVMAGVEGTNTQLARTPWPLDDRVHRTQVQRQLTLDTC